ncbi:MAG: hypothetical protein IJY93_01490 [Clostridia bacterium]|nr:hypothetical protein [Clostridia bacterium]
MLKDKIKGAAAGLFAGILISATVVGATTGAIQRELHYNNIQITLDGKNVHPTDANGKYVEPFIIDGTTYLPVRAVSNALGLGVDWDGNTNTVKLTTSGTQAEVKPAETIPTISNTDALCDYMHSKKESDILTFKFKYTGNQDDINATRMADMLCCFYLSWERTGDVYTVTVTEYPGDHIVDAHRKGDTSSLTYDERLTYNKALEMVEEARRNSNSMIELEIAIHDMLCESIVYDNSNGTYVADKNKPPRHLTAVGALLDGRANCQGYTDAFYLLASLAGFEVGRQFVEDYETTHMTNTIRLDGKWYIVDVTYDDVDINDGNTIKCYRLFNAGEDMCTEYWWPDDMEYHNICEYSGSNYYYNLPGYVGGNDYTKSFTSVYDMAEMIADEWMYNGRTHFNTVLLGVGTDWTALDDPLYDILTERGAPVNNYTLYSTNANENTFFYLYFN